MHDAHFSPTGQCVICGLLAEGGLCDSHLPAEDQRCEVCEGEGHVWCMPIDEPWVEPLAAVLADPYGHGL